MTAYLGFQIVKKVNSNGTTSFDVYAEKQGLFSPFQVHLGTYMTEGEAEAEIANNSSATTTNYSAAGAKQ